MEGYFVSVQKCPNWPLSPLPILQFEKLCVTWLTWRTLQVIYQQIETFEDHFPHHDVHQQDSLKKLMHFFTSVEATSVFDVSSLCRHSLPCPPLHKLRTGPMSLWCLSWPQGWSSGLSIKWWSAFRKRCRNCQKSVSVRLDQEYNWIVKYRRWI